MQEHDCTKIISKVFLALDGELSPSEEKEFLDELNRCSCCLETYSIEKAFKKFLTKRVERRPVNNKLVFNIKEKIKTISVNE